jgi:GTP-binding protein EngB required for normal cell division
METVMDTNAPDNGVTGPGKTNRKPRVALMGEFSAGKSTLLNLLLGCDPLPVRITATRVPPVWISYGEDAAARVTTGGAEEPLSVGDLGDAPLEDTKLLRMSLRSEILKLCDLIDMPGISDPNMPREMWESLIEEVDFVIWCTYATQAWRQSEAAVWEEVVERTNGNNILAITQFDKLKTKRDRDRVLARVKRETDGAFAHVFPVALIDALNAGDDNEAWKQSGAQALAETFVDLLLHPEKHETVTEEEPEPAQPVRTATSDDSSEQNAGFFDKVLERHGAEEPEDSDSQNANAEDATKIVPKRIRPGPDASARPRPEKLTERPDSRERRRQHA